MVVQFYKTKNDGAQQAVGTVELKEGRVVFRNLPGPFVEELQEFGILYNGRTYFPEDGKRFLELLPIMYGGSMFRAEKIEEE